MFRRTILRFRSIFLLRRPPNNLWNLQEKRDTPRAVPYPQSYVPDRLSLNIEIFYVQRVLFNELAARFHVLAHQGRKDQFAGRDVFQLD